MANDQINQYPVTAVTIDDASFFDIDQWTGAAFESQKVPATLMASIFGQHIGNSDLQCTDAIRKLLLQGIDPDGVKFSIRNSADTIDFFKVAGGGIITFNEAFSFPLVDGAAGEVLKTDGAGNLSWGAGGGAGTNIGNSDLTISATGVRKLIFGGASGLDRFVLRNSADTKDLFWQGGDGSFALGYDAINLGSNPTYNVVIGKDASNNFQSNVVAIGHQAFSTAIGGTAIGKDAQVLSNYGTSVGNLAFSGLNSVAIGKSANASLGQYNISIGELSNCTAFFGVALGRSVTAGDRATAINGSATLVQGVAMGYGSSAGSYALSLGGYASTGNHGTAIGYNTSANGLNLAVGRGMETSGNYSVSIGACPYAQVRTNSVASTFNWFTDNANPVVRFGETADQWNMGSGSFGYGTMTPDASAVVDISSVDKGFLPPRMTTIEKNGIGTPATGLIVYDTTLNKLCVYTGGAWETITSS